MSIFILTWLYFSLQSLMKSAMVVGFFFTIVSAGVAVVFNLQAEDTHNEDRQLRYSTISKYGWKWARGMVILWLVSLFLSAFLPGEKQLLRIVGVGAAYHLTQTDEAKKLPDNVLKAVNTFLENAASKKSGGGGS
jgi:hypothetical protein